MPEPDDLEQRLRRRLAREVDSVRGRPGLTAAARLAARRRRAHRALGAAVAVAVAAGASLALGSVVGPHPDRSASAGPSACATVGLVQGRRTFRIYPGPADTTATLSPSVATRLQVTGPCADDVRVQSSDKDVLAWFGPNGDDVHLHPGSPLLQYDGTVTVSVAPKGCSDDSAASTCATTRTFTIPVAPDPCPGTVVSLVQGSLHRTLYQFPGPVPERGGTLDLAADEPVRIIRRGACASDVQVSYPDRVATRSEHILGPDVRRGFVPHRAAGEETMTVTGPSTCAHGLTPPQEACAGGPGPMIDVRVRVS